MSKITLLILYGHCNKHMNSMFLYCVEGVLYHITNVCMYVEIHWAELTYCCCFNIISPVLSHTHTQVVCVCVWWQMILRLSEWVSTGRWFAWIFPHGLLHGTVLKRRCVRYLCVCRCKCVSQERWARSQVLHVWMISQSKQQRRWFV